MGGARSGKSQRAEKLAISSGKPVTYIATAPILADDPEWQQRIAHHRARRPSDWRTLEVPHDLAEAIQHHHRSNRTLLIDCLSLWLSNRLLADADIDDASDILCANLRCSTGDIILVSNEVGMGLVPEQALGRAFRDAQGRLNQRIATCANRVEFVVAGIPLCLKKHD
ncbi:MAG: bifunctional adenosylcobinamide kinase/adenosylcobinamide-phosphate guanylyltransferase [Mariprofundales bacterium]|nr:bifunctional adenosylcobinamide kinase/adenosylcobinamide-phosphate guanylyltransferase [Mariprofundales bacterium]